MLPKQLRFLHPYLHFTGLLLMVVGLPFSMLLMSLSQFFIGGNWILEGNFIEKLKRFKSNKSAIALCCIFIMLLPPLFWSTNTNEALKLIRLNLPFLIFPFVLGSIKPLQFSWYKLLIRLFIVSVFLAVIVCSSIGLPRWMNGELTDIRHISLFISHIRFSLLIAFALLLILWMTIKKPFEFLPYEKYVLPSIGLILLAFLFILQSLNGIIILCIVGGIWLMKEIRSRFNLPTTLVIYSIPALFLGLSIYFAGNAWQNYFTPNEIYSAPLPAKTALGNPYKHSFGMIENGHYVDAFLCEDEVRSTWNQRSSLSIDSADGKGHPVFTTLVRYLNSKGLTKDQAGVMALNEKDIRYIENGTANVNYTGLLGIRMRFYQLLYELDFQKRGGTNASGHSLMMKLEFWKNGLSLIRKNPIFGTGTGDVPADFREQYKFTASWLTPQWWMTSHNQFIYFAVGLGIPGLLLFLFLFFYPAIQSKAFNYLPFTLFFSIAFLSMFTEDMLTTQAGVSFVVFFYAFFLFARPRENDSASEKSGSPVSSSSAS
jgi:hypothetical protein